MSSVLKNIVATHLTTEETQALFAGGAIVWKNLYKKVDMAKKISEGARETEFTKTQIKNALKRAAKTIIRLQKEFERFRTDVTVGRKLGDTKVDKHPPIVYHDRSSKLVKTISLENWNALGFSQIESPSCSKEKGKSGWIRNNVAECKTQSNTLYDHVWTKTKGRKDTVTMFHGSIARFEKSLMTGIKWRVGEGVMGPGFYACHNPNVAKAYACRAIHINGGLSKFEKCIMLELRVSQASTITLDTYDSKYFMKPKKGSKSFVTNHIKGFDGQVAFREKAIDLVKIVRIHVFDCENLYNMGVDDMKRERC